MISNMSNVHMTLYNKETGKELMKLDDIEDIKLETNTLYESRYDKEEHKLNNRLTSGSCEMTFNCDTTALNLDALFGIDLAQKPDAYDISFIKIIQCRKHKNKRINKKWAKRYGYRQVEVVSKGWQINTYTDGSFEFKKNMKLKEK